MIPSDLQRSHKKTQMSVSRYFTEVFQITLDYFKEVIHSNATITTMQQEYHSCFSVMFSLIDLVGIASGKFQFNDILKDLGYLTKYFRFVWDTIHFCSSPYIIHLHFDRKTWDKAQMAQSNRNLYINTLYVMSKIVLMKRELNSNEASDTFRSDNNNSNRSCGSKWSNDQTGMHIWRQELETALFDFMLKQSYSEVYGTLLKAVQVKRQVQSIDDSASNKTKIFSL